MKAHDAPSQVSDVDNKVQEHFMYSRLPCHVFCIGLLTTNKYQKYKSVELGDQLLYVYPFKKHVHSICGFNPIWCKGDKAQYQNGLILGKVANRL